MLNKITLLLFLSINLFAQINIQTKLIKEDTELNILNNDIVFNNDKIKFVVTSDSDDNIKISYKVNNQNVQLLSNVKLLKDQISSFPKDGNFIIFDSKVGKIEFTFESLKEKKRIIFITNPKINVSLEEDFIFNTDEKRIYINNNKIISNNRGIKESDVIIPKLESSTVIVNVNGNIGTGVVINEGKNILTNYHVVEPDENNIYIALKPEMGDTPSTNNYFKANLTKVNMLKDLALIELPKELKNYKKLSSLKLADFNSIKKGIDIYTIGHPHGFYFSFEYGMLNKLVDDFNWITYKVNSALQYSMNSNRGNSGGPIVNDKLELLGIVAGSDTSGNNLNFGISVLDIKEFIEEKENVRVEKIDLNAYKNKIVTVGIYKNIHYAKLDRNNNGIYDAMMKDINNDGIWDMIAYDSDENGSYERITSFR